MTTIPTPVLRIHPLSQYKFARTPNSFHSFGTVDAKLRDLYKKVEIGGPQLYLEIVVVVNDIRADENAEVEPAMNRNVKATKWNPSILLFEVDDGVYRLPGGDLRIGEGESDAVNRIYSECLGVTDQERGKLLMEQFDDVIQYEQQQSNAPKDEEVVLDPPSEDRMKQKQDYEQRLLQDRDSSFAVTDVLFTTHRPHFDNITYPYLAPHIKRPKQTIKTLVLELNPSKIVIGVPQNVKLLAVPLFELYGNRKFGVLEQVVWGLSRFTYQ
jgi:hypothetical protein